MMWRDGPLRNRTLWCLSSSLLLLAAASLLSPVDAAAAAAFHSNGAVALNSQYGPGSSCQPRRASTRTALYTLDPSKKLAAAGDEEADAVPRGLWSRVVTQRNVLQMRSLFSPRRRQQCSNLQDIISQGEPMNSHKAVVQLKRSQFRKVVVSLALAYAVWLRPYQVEQAQATAISASISLSTVVSKAKAASLPFKKAVPPAAVAAVEEPVAVVNTAKRNAERMIQIVTGSGTLLVAASVGTAMAKRQKKSQPVDANGKPVDACCSQPPVADTANVETAKQSSLIRTSNSNSATLASTTAEMTVGESAVNGSNVVVSPSIAVMERERDAALSSSTSPVGGAEQVEFAKVKLEILDTKMKMRKAQTMLNTVIDSVKEAQNKAVSLGQRISPGQTSSIAEEFLNNVQAKNQEEMQRLDALDSRLEAMEKEQDAVYKQAEEEAAQSTLPSAVETASAEVATAALSSNPATDGKGPSMSGNFSANVAAAPKTDADSAVVEESAPVVAAVEATPVETEAVVQEFVPEPIRIEEEQVVIEEPSIIGETVDVAPSGEENIVADEASLEISEPVEDIIDANEGHVSVVAPEAQEALLETVTEAATSVAVEASAETGEQLEEVVTAVAAAEVEECGATEPEQKAAGRSTGFRKSLSNTVSNLFAREAREKEKILMTTSAATTVDDATQATATVEELLPVAQPIYIPALRSPEEEAALQQKYAAIESLEERAFQILLDLGMVGRTGE